MKFKPLVAALTLACALVSCSSSKTVLPYFTDISDVSEGSYPVEDYLPQIKADDELYISIYSVIPAVTAQYNLPASNPATMASLVDYSTPRQMTYIVSSEGDITLPTIGKIHVAGKTVEELEKELYTTISKDVDDPIVRVQLVNFRVIVAGEVNRPGTQNVTTSRYSILDALSDAGDLTAYGERSKILLIREENGKRTFHHLNLNSSEVLSSPYFYLRQNDYVYVEPNKVRQSNAKYNQDNAYKITVISTVVSACSVVASLIIALSD
jgi:polysaccharide export outer membrane protein